MDAQTQLTSLQWEIRETLQAVVQDFTDFLSHVDGFTDTEKQILVYVLSKNWEAIEKCPYMAIQGLVKRKVLTYIAGEKLVFVGKVKAQHRELDRH